MDPLVTIHCYFPYIYSPRPERIYDLAPLFSLNDEKPEEEDVPNLEVAPPIVATMYKYSDIGPEGNELHPQESNRPKSVIDLPKCLQIYHPEFGSMRNATPLSAPARIEYHYQNTLESEIITPKLPSSPCYPFCGPECDDVHLFPDLIPEDPMYYELDYDSDSGYEADSDSDSDMDDYPTLKDLVLDSEPDHDSSDWVPQPPVGTGRPMPTPKVFELPYWLD